jgi:hypothetical protein
MGVVTPATLSPPAATSVADAMVVLANTALVARSVHDTKVPDVAADSWGSGGSSLPPQALKARAEPVSNTALTLRYWDVRRMHVSCWVGEIAPVLVSEGNQI